jgi:hypothetical protein
MKGCRIEARNPAYEQITDKNTLLSSTPPGMNTNAFITD